MMPAQLDCQGKEATYLLCCCGGWSNLSLEGVGSRCQLHHLSSFNSKWVSPTESIRVEG